MRRRGRSSTIPLAPGSRSFFRTSLFKARTRRIRRAEDRGRAPEGHRPDEYEHVYEGMCRQAVSGVVYRNELLAADKEGRICPVPYDASKPVDTFWDLGYPDNVSIWLAQSIGFEFRVIDFIQGRAARLRTYGVRRRTSGGRLCRCCSATCMRFRFVHRSLRLHAILHGADRTSPFRTCRSFHPMATLQNIGLAGVFARLAVNKPVASSVLAFLWIGYLCGTFGLLAYSAGTIKRTLKGRRRRCCWRKRPQRYLGRATRCGHQSHCLGC